MKFILHRDHVHASTMGLSIEFKKGEPTLVPKEMWPEVVAIGAIPEDEAGYEGERKVDAVPTDPEVRQQAIIGAFEKILSKNDREDFTSGGAPHMKTIAKIVGFSISANERDEAWLTFKQVGQDD